MVPSRAKLVLSCILHNIPKLRGMPYISPRKETVFRFEKRFPVKLVTSLEKGTNWNKNIPQLGNGIDFIFVATVFVFGFGIVNLDPPILLVPESCLKLKPVTKKLQQGNPVGQPVNPCPCQAFISSEYMGPIGKKEVGR